LNISTHKKSEVDLRVAQELKNNQDFIYQTNQSLQNLSVAIDSLSTKIEKRLNGIENRQAAIEIAFENMNSDVIEHFKASKSVIKDISDYVEKSLDVVSKRMENLRASTPEKDVVTSCFDIVNGLYNSLATEIHDVRDIISNRHKEIQSKIVDSSDSLRKELTPIKPEIDPIEASVNSKINDMYVDFASLKQEIAILKKASYYSEKQFEFMVTQLERLKGSCHEPSR